MDLLNELAGTAHDDCTTDGRFFPRDVAMRFLDAVRELEPSGDPWVVAFLDSIAITGASKWLADWRRNSRFQVKTLKGTETDVGEYAGTVNEDGEHEQMRLFEMSAEELKRHIDKLEAHRDTLSREIRFLSDLLEAMVADPSLATAGDAFRKLGLAA